jgi:hypothetical protein
LSFSSIITRTMSHLCPVVQARAIELFSDFDLFNGHVNIPANRIRSYK